MLQSQLETIPSHVCLPGGTKVYSPVTQPCFACHLDTADSQSETVGSARSPTESLVSQFSTVVATMLQALGNVIPTLMHLL